MSVILDLIPKIVKNFNTIVYSGGTGTPITGPTCLISMYKDFPTKSHRLLHPAEGETQEVVFELSKRHFPRSLDHIWLESEDTIDDELMATGLAIRFKDDYKILLVSASPSSVPETVPNVTINGLNDINNNNDATITLGVAQNTRTLDAEVWKDLYLLLPYEIVTADSGSIRSVSYTDL